MDPPPPYGSDNQHNYYQAPEAFRQEQATYTTHTQNGSYQQQGVSNSLPPGLQRPLQKPIAIPATQDKLGSPFLRAYPPVLEEYGLSREVFLRFIDDFNRVTVSSPPVQILGLAGSVVGLVPLATAQIVGGSVEAAARLSTVAISKGRGELCIRKANEELFGPHGLKLEVARLDALARIANIPILEADGKIDKKSPLLEPIEDPLEFDTVSAQQRRLRSLEGWIQHLDITPLPEQHVPDNVMSKMHAAASERQRERGEKKMVKDRRKAQEDYDKDSRKAQEDYEKDMRKLGKEEEKVRRKESPDKIDKKLKKIEKEKEKIAKEYEKEMRKVDKDRRKDDKEEKSMRKILWILIRNVDDTSGMK